MNKHLIKAIQWSAIILLILSSFILSPSIEAGAASHLKTFSNGVIKVTVPKMKSGTQMYLVVEKGNSSYSFRLPRSQQVTVPFGSGSYSAYLYKGNGRSFDFVEQRHWKSKVSALEIARQRTVLTPGTSEKHVTYLMKTYFKGWQKWSQEKRVSEVHKFITKRYKYDYQLEKNIPDWYQPDYNRLSKYKKGICYDFASLNASLLREMKIPTRLVMGYPENTSSYHAWNEVYVSKKWKVVDTTFDLGSKTKTPYKSEKLYKKVSYRM